MMTEEDAKEKWCPYTRVMNANGLGCGNRWDNTVGYYAPNGSLCVGSTCMAWRWGPNNGRVFEPLNVPGSGGGSYQGDPWKVGYCGLAGKP